MSVAVIGAYLATDSGYLSGRFGLAATSIILLVYTLLEIRYAIAERPARWLLNPAILCSLVTFALSYGITNYLFLHPHVFPIAQRILERVDYGWLSFATLVATVAAIGMWTGYHARLGKSFVYTLSRWRFASQILKRGSIRWSVVVALGTIGIGAYVLQIWLGVYGYLTVPEESLRYIFFTQYLTLASQLVPLALIAASLSYFARTSNDPVHGAVVVVLFAAELFFGFASGFKSHVVLPFIIVGVTFYVARGHLQRVAVLGAVCAVILAYQVVEPLRIMYQDTTAERSTSIGHVAGMVVEAASANSWTSSMEPSNPSSTTPLNLTNLSSRVLSRRSLTGFTALAMEHGETHGPSPSDPQFLTDLVLAPAYAMIPRLLWPSKPHANLGGWFYKEVLGGTSNTAVAMGPVGYLWLAGGPFLVFFGFFIIGVVQRVAYDYLVLVAGGGGILVFIAVLGPLSNIHSAVYTVFIDVIRIGLLTIMAQHVLIRRGPNSLHLPG